MNICIFCSAADLDEKYVIVARTFGKLLAERGHSLVWGGSYVGLMRVIADSVKEYGGIIRGVSVEKFRQNAHPHADEMVVAQDLAERKALFLQKSDVLVALVGGTGTLDEISEMIELKKYGVHNKPVIILNTNGFYDGLQQQFARMDGEGFLYFPLNDIVHFSETPEDVFRYLEGK